MIQISQSKSQWQGAGLNSVEEKKQTMFPINLDENAHAQHYNHFLKNPFTCNLLLSAMLDTVYAPYPNKLNN